MEEAENWNVKMEMSNWMHETLGGVSFNKRFWELSYVTALYGSTYMIGLKIWWEWYGWIIGLMIRCNVWNSVRDCRGLLVTDSTSRSWLVNLRFLYNYNAESEWSERNAIRQDWYDRFSQFHVLFVDHSCKNWAIMKKFKKWVEEFVKREMLLTPPIC